MRLFYEWRRSKSIDLRRRLRRRRERGDDLSDKLLVGGGESIVCKFGRAHPQRFLAFDQLRLAVDMIAEERIQPQADVGIVVLDRREGRADDDVHRDLFAQFAKQTLVKCFAEFALAAWKFPVPAE